MEMTLGKRIAFLRKDKEFKQDELAEKLGVSAQAVSKWENDQTCPDITLLPELAKLLGVTVDELLSGKSEPKVRILPEAERKDIKDMMLRVIMDSERGEKMRINVPLALVQLAVDAGMSIPEISGCESLSLSNIDLNQVMDLVRQGVIGNLVEMESAEGQSIRIFVE